MYVVVNFIIPYLARMQKKGLCLQIKTDYICDLGGRRVFRSLVCKGKIFDEREEYSQ